MGQDRLAVEQAVAGVDAGVTAGIGIQNVFDECLLGTLLVEMRLHPQAVLPGEGHALLSQRRVDAHRKPVGDDQPPAEVMGEGGDVVGERRLIGAEIARAASIHEHEAHAPQIGQLLERHPRGPRVHGHVRGAADHAIGQRVGREVGDHVPRVGRPLAAALGGKHVLFEARQQPATGGISANVFREPAANRMLGNVNVGIEQRGNDDPHAPKHRGGVEIQPRRHLVPCAHGHEPATVVPHEHAVGKVVDARCRRRVEQRAPDRVQTSNHAGTCRGQVSQRCSHREPGPRPRPPRMTTSHCMHVPS